MLRRWTPVKVTINPARSVMVVVVFAVLNPWNRIVDAMITLVEKVTKYVGLTLHKRVRHKFDGDDVDVHIC